MDNKINPGLVTFVAGLILLPIGFFMFFSAGSGMGWVVMLSGYVLLLLFGGMMVSFSVGTSIEIPPEKVAEVKGRVGDVLGGMGYRAEADGETYAPLLSVFLPATVVVRKSGDSLVISGPSMCIGEVKRNFGL